MRTTDTGASFFRQWILPAGPVQPSYTPLGQAEPTTNRTTPIRQRTFYGCPQKAVTKDRQAQQQKAATSKEVSKAKGLSGGQEKQQSQSMSSNATRSTWHGWRRNQKGQTYTHGGSRQKRDKKRSARDTKTAYRGADEEAPRPLIDAPLPKTKALQAPKTG